jgi:hypothetical protein
MMVRAAPITSYWTVGFTGHRSLPDPERIAALIGVELAALGGKIHGKLAAISSIASGGDTLFVEEALKLNLPWIALLPFPRDEFAKDFQPAEWERAARCLSNAIVEELWSATPDRPNAYHDLGIKMIDECDILIAVWDGETSRGRGGTADMVEYARQRKTPLIWIHANEGTVVREGWGTELFAIPFSNVSSRSQRRKSKRRPSPLWTPSFIRWMRPRPRTFPAFDLGKRKSYFLTLSPHSLRHLQ